MSASSLHGVFSCVYIFTILVILDDKNAQWMGISLVNGRSL